MADRESYGRREDRVNRVIDRMEALFSAICNEEDLTGAEMLGCWLTVMLENWWHMSDAANKPPDSGGGE